MTAAAHLFGVGALSGLLTLAMLAPYPRPRRTRDRSDRPGGPR